MDQKVPEQPPHTPNHIPLHLRVFYVLLSGALLAYGAYGLWVDDLFMPGKRRGGIHLHGPEAWLMYFAFVAGALNMLSVVVDHFDRRNNETNYRRFGKITSWAAILFFAASLLAYVARGFSTAHGG